VALAAGDVSDLPPGSYVVVAVHDTGAGMPAEVAARAFEAFYTTKPAGKGSGLGLSVVHAFARHAGGTARIVSRPGEGTTVFLYLPRATATAKAAARTEAPRRPRAASPAAATMLLIEPEELVRQVTTDALTELGHRVLQAEDGEAALGLLRRGDPVDLVICPADMPNGTRGGDFAREARQIRGGLRVLLTADDPLAGDAAEGAESAVAVVTKPYGPKRLAAAIADLMSAG
jgi:CheY-like chemotaxis protein